MKKYAPNSKTDRTIKDIRTRRRLQWLSDQIKLVDEEIDLLTREKDDLYCEADEMMAKMYR